MAAHCSRTSATTTAAAMSCGSSSCLSGLSAPTAATKVPGRTCSRRRKGLRDGVQVTHTSLSRERPSAGVGDRRHLDAQLGATCSARVGPARRLRPRRRRRRARSGSTRARARSCARPWLPQPQIVTAARVRPGQLPRRHRGGRGRAADRHLDRVHHRQRPPVVGVAEDDDALDGGQPVPARVVRRSSRWSWPRSRGGPGRGPPP